MNMNMEKRSSTGSADHNESTATTADQDTNKQPPEIPGSTESASNPATSTPNEPADAQSPEEPGSGESTNKPATATAPESANTQHSEEPTSGGYTKNPAAVSLGRLGGLKGGKARAKSLTTKERSEAARKAALARWQKKKQTK
jgi:hypothetical protein